MWLQDIRFSFKGYQFVKQFSVVLVRHILLLNIVSIIADVCAIVYFVANFM